MIGSIFYGSGDTRIGAHNPKTPRFASFLISIRDSVLALPSADRDCVGSGDSDPTDPTRPSKKMPTQSRVKEILNYDPESGRFTYLKNDKTNRQRAGMTAGYINQRGYRKILIDGKYYFAHRIAWLYVYGRWPLIAIDHINRVKDDNRISNLREATHSLNNRNKGGVKGYHAHYGRWQAAISINGRQFALGTFDTPEEARAAYVGAAKVAGVLA